MICVICKRKPRDCPVYDPEWQARAWQSVKLRKDKRVHVCPLCYIAADQTVTCEVFEEEASKGVGRIGTYEIESWYSVLRVHAPTKLDTVLRSMINLAFEQRRGTAK